MGDGKIGLNPKGALGAVGRRMKRQSADAKAMGLNDPYKRKKKPKPKKKKGLRFYLMGKFPKYKKLMDALD